VCFCTNFYVCNRQIKDVTIFIFSKHTASEDSLFILIIILFRQSIIQYLLSFLMSDTLFVYICLHTNARWRKKRPEHLHALFSRVVEMNQCKSIYVTIKHLQICV